MSWKSFVYTVGSNKFTSYLTFYFLFIPDNRTYHFQADDEQECLM